MIDSSFLLSLYSSTYIVCWIVCLFVRIGGLICILVSELIESIGWIVIC